MLQARGSIAALAGEVERLSSACECGKIVFADFMTEVRSISFAREVQDCILKLEESQYSSDAIQKTKDNLYAKALVAAKSNTSGFAKREVKIEYLGVDLAIVVPDVHQEWNMCLSAHLKQKLVMQDSTFPRLPWEDWVLAPVVGGSSVEVEHCRHSHKSSGACTPQCRSLVVLGQRRECS